MNKKLLLILLLSLSSLAYQSEIIAAEAEESVREKGETAKIRKIRKSAEDLDREIKDIIKDKTNEVATQKDKFAELDEHFNTIKEKIKEMGQIDEIENIPWEYHVFIRLFAVMIDTIKAGLGKAEENMAEWRIDGTGHRKSAADQMIEIIQNSNLGKYSDEANDMRQTYMERVYDTVQAFLKDERTILRIFKKFKDRLDNDNYVNTMTKGFEEIGKKEVEWAEKSGKEFNALLSRIEGYDIGGSEVTDDNIREGFPPPENRDVALYFRYLEAMKRKYYAMENEQRAMTKNEWNKTIEEKRLSGPVKIKFEDRFILNLQKSGVVKTTFKDVGKKHKTKGFKKSLSALGRAFTKRKTNFEKWEASFEKLLDSKNLLKPGLKQLLDKLRKAPNQKKRNALEAKVRKRVNELQKKPDVFLAIYNNTKETYEQERHNLIANATGKEILVRGPAGIALQQLGEGLAEEIKEAEEEEEKKKEERQIKALEKIEEGVEAKVGPLKELGEGLAEEIEAEEEEEGEAGEGEEEKEEPEEEVEEGDVEESDEGEAPDETAPDRPLPPIPGGKPTRQLPPTPDVADMLALEKADVETEPEAEPIVESEPEIKGELKPGEGTDIPEEAGEEEAGEVAEEGEGDAGEAEGGEEAGEAGEGEGDAPADE